MNNGQNIPQGYKKTTIGFIPQGWEIKRLKTIVTPVKTFSYSRDKLSDNVQTLIYIHYGDIHKSGEKYSVNLNVDRLPYLMDGILSENQISANDFPKLQSGDILLPDASEDYDGIGHAWELQNVGQQNVIGGLHTIAIRPNPQFVLLGYGSLMFYSWPVSKALKRIAQGTKVYSISFNLIDNIKILLPPLKEQQKIAEILGTWDKAIEKQTQLIRKLELRKKGLMQQLLTGKKRLPGFSGEWRKVKLEEIASLYQPQTIQSEDLLSTGFPVYGANGLIGYYKKFNHELPQVVITCRGSSCGTVNYTPEKCWITGNAMVLNVDNNQNINKTFFYYLISNSSFAHLISGSGQPQIVRQPLLKFELLIPTFKEQTAIAQVLTTADREIELAQQKFELLRQQKRGLMQQLLTGKKRVKL